jgi:outer membrane lipoprotein carrier protein
MKTNRLWRRSGILAAAAFLAANLCGWARTPAASEPPAQDAAKSSSVKEVAHRVDEHYNALQSLKAGFTEAYEGLGIRRTESGTLLLRKPGRMKWNYNSPPGKVFLLDGKYAWFYTRGDAQVQRLPAKELNDLRSPLRFLLGHTELEKELTGLAVVGGPDDELTLTGIPKGEEDRVRRITLTVTPAGVITALAIEEMDGALTRFTFTGEEQNTPIPAATFHFTPPPGVPVVDMPPPV